MITKTKLVLAAAIILGAVSAAAANDHEDRGGFEVQTWQDVQRARENIQREIQSKYNTGNGSFAYGAAWSTGKPTSARVKSRRND